MSSIVPSALCQVKMFPNVTAEVAVFLFSASA